MKTIIILLLAISSSFSAYSTCRVDTTYTYTYITGTTTRNLTGRIINTYNSQNVLSQKLTQDVVSNAWVNKYLQTNTINAQKLITEELYQSWSVSTVSWGNSKKFLNTYNSSKLLTEITIQRAVGLAWENETQNSYTYNASNKLETEIKKTWNNSTAVWIKEDKKILSYTGNGLTADSTIQIWSSSAIAWSNQSRFTFSYDTYPHLTQLTYLSWNTATLQWDSASRDVFTYDANNRVAKIKTDDYIGASSIWLERLMKDYLYDAYNLLIRETYQRVIASAFTYILEVRYEYNAANDLILYSILNNYNTSTYKYENRTDYEYRCTGLNVGINDLSETSKFSVYPNPVSSSSITINSIEKADYALIDLTGKLLQTGDLNEGENRIDINLISAGVYFVRVGNQTRKMIVQ